MEAIKKLYCKTNNIRPNRDIILTENVNKCLAHLAAQAFKHMTQDKTYFEYDLSDVQEYGIESQDPIFKLGLLRFVNRSIRGVCFINRFVTEK